MLLNIEQFEGLIKGMQQGRRLSIQSGADCVGVDLRPATYHYSVLD
jgi:hypothetical protein